MKKFLLLAIGLTALAANPVYAQKYPTRIASRDAVGQKTSIISSASVDRVGHYPDPISTRLQEFGKLSQWL